MKKVLVLSAMSLSFVMISCKKEDAVEKDLKEAAATMNKMTPQVLSEGVRLDSVSVGAGKVLQYNYTLTEDVKEEITAEEINQYQSDAKNEALKNIETSPDMKDFRDHDVTLKYVYYDKNGHATADFSVTPSEYKKR